MVKKCELERCKAEATENRTGEMDTCPLMILKVLSKRNPIISTILNYNFGRKEKMPWNSLRTFKNIAAQNF